MIRFVPWSEVGTITVSPGDNVVEVGAFELAEGADTLWVRMTNTGTPGPWPWSYGILSFKTDEGQPLGSIKAYNSFDGEVFRLGVGLPPSVRAGVLTFEPRGFNMAWIKQGNPWSLKFEAQSGSSTMSNNLWSRAANTLSPTNEGDDVNLTTGSLIATSVSCAGGKGEIVSNGSFRSSFGQLHLGGQYGYSYPDSSSCLIRAGDASPYGSIRLQMPNSEDPSKSAIRAIWNGSISFDLNYDGSFDTRGLVRASDLVVVSADPGFYRSVGDDVVYSGPELSLLSEIVRLESLVKELYEKLRMAPEGGWPVWDGNEDLIMSNIAKSRHI